MSCPACEARASTPHSGRYHFACLQCCAALICSARPNRLAREAQLAAIAVYKDSPGRDEILEKLKLISL